MEQLVARWAHNPKATGSSPVPATREKDPASAGFFVFRLIESDLPNRYNFSRSPIVIIFASMGDQVINSNYMMSFQERAKLAMEILSNQPPVTLAMARRQAKRLSSQSVSKVRKRRN